MTAIETKKLMNDAYDYIYDQVSERFQIDDISSRDCVVYFIIKWMYDDLKAEHFKNYPNAK